jgi:glycine/D-amino acid oxidase-like deaminating enzyme
MLIEPPIYLSCLLRDFQEAGGEVVARQFSDRAELLSLTEPVIFNCSGLGARELFNDAELTPVRGQLVVLPPDARVDYMTHGLGDGLLYTCSRAAMA